MRNPSGPQNIGERSRENGSAHRERIALVLLALATPAAGAVACSFVPDVKTAEDLREAAVDDHNGKVFLVTEAGASVRLHRDSAADGGVGTVLRGVITLSADSVLQHGSGMDRTYDLPPEAAPWIRMTVLPADYHKTGQIKLTMKDGLTMIFDCEAKTESGEINCPGSEFTEEIVIDAGAESGDGGMEGGLEAGAEAGSPDADISDGGLVDGATDGGLSDSGSDSGLPETNLEVDSPLTPESVLAKLDLIQDLVMLDNIAAAVIPNGENVPLPRQAKAHIKRWIESKKISLKKLNRIIDEKLKLLSESDGGRP